MRSTNCFCAIQSTGISAPSNLESLNPSGCWPWLTATKPQVRKYAPASLDELRETLGTLLQLIASPAIAASRTTLVKHAGAVGKDFELRTGRHLGIIGTK